MEKPLKPKNGIMKSKTHTTLNSPEALTLKPQQKMFGFQEIRRVVEALKQPEMPQDAFDEKAKAFFEELKAKLLESGHELEKGEFYSKGPVSHSFVEYQSLSPAILSILEKIPHPTIQAVQLGKKPKSTEILLLLKRKINFDSEKLKKSLQEQGYSTKDVLQSGDWFNVFHKERKVACVDGKNGITLYAPHTSQFTPEFEERFKTIYELIMSHPKDSSLEEKKRGELPDKT